MKLTGACTQAIFAIYNFSANYFTMLDKLGYLARIFSLLLMGKPGSLCCDKVQIVQIHLGTHQALPLELPGALLQKPPRRPSAAPRAPLRVNASPHRGICGALLYATHALFPDAPETLILAHLIEVLFFRLSHFFLQFAFVPDNFAYNPADCYAFS